MTLPHQVYLPQIGRRISVYEGETILQAALAAGISYAHGCRMGGGSTQERRRRKG